MNATFIEPQGAGAVVPGFTQNFTISASGSLIDGIKTQVAGMVARTDFEVKLSALYANPVSLNLIDQEAKTFQLYMNETEIQPGVIVKAIPTQAGLLPLIPEPFITVYQTLGPGATKQYEFLILSEEFVEYHWLTTPVPRVFQLGLVGNLAAQFVILSLELSL